MVRQHPRAPEFFQFLDEDEQHMVAQEKVKELEVQQNQAIKSKEYKKLLTSLRSSGLQAADYEKVLGPVGGSDEDGDDDNDDPNGEDGYLPKALKTLMGDNTRKKKKPLADATPAEKDPETCTAAPDDTKAIIVEKAKKMLKYLNLVSGPQGVPAKTLITTIKKQIGDKKVDKKVLIDAAKLYKKWEKNS